MTAAGSLRIAALAERYASDESEPERVVRDVFRRVQEAPDGVYIERAPLERMLSDLEAARHRKAAGEPLPLYGVPFAVKDNIDVAGFSTTAACPAFAYAPERSARVVELLLRAGAIVAGKTNLDQFATGLSGTRSPYGLPKNPFDPDFIVGGSSSGSAVAVATSAVSFALGTDTAGSGRVPAAFTNIVGLKPTRGLLSLRGVVPACRTLDCVSIFAGSLAEAALVFDVCARFDTDDPYSRARESTAPFASPLRIGVPHSSQLEFFGDSEAEHLYSESIARCEALGAQRVEIDFEPFLDAARLLYAGPWVSERLVAAGALLESSPDAIFPAVRTILEGARGGTALDAFRGQYRLAELTRAAERQWLEMDLLLLPTTPTIYPVAEMLSDPIGLNSRLGTYTNFVNLLDLCAAAVPAGFRKDGLPLGVTLMARAHQDLPLCRIAARLHAALGGTIGATAEPLIDGSIAVPAESSVLLAVAGAHLTGEPLNHQLTSRGARRVRACRTASQYRLFALAGVTPPKPGVALDPTFAGPGIEVEVWSLDPAAFGSFVNEVPPPMVIGTITLEDGARVKGFLCEGHAISGATEITSFGGWKRYLSQPA